MKKKLFYLFLLFPFVSLLAQKNNISALQEQLSNAPSDSTKIELSIQLLKSYTSIDIDSSIYYFEKAIHLAKEINNTQLIISTQKTLSENLMFKGYYTKAKIFIDEGIALGHQLHSDSIICSNLMTLVTWHWEMSNTMQSFEVLDKALDFANKAKSVKYKAMIFSSYGIFYGDQGDAKKEKEYFQKSLQIFEEIKDTTNQIILLQNLANSYFYVNDFLTALEYINNAIDLMKSFSSNDLLYQHVRAFKGNILYNLGQTELGFSILDSVLTVATNKKNSRLIVLISNEKSKWLLKDQRYEEAINTANTAVNICKKTGYIHQLPELCNTISQSYKAKKDFESTLKWINEENQAIEELKIRQQEKELTLLEANHELSQKEAENQILLLKNKNQKILIALLITSGLIFSFFVFSYFERKQKIKLEIFRQRIAADLHDDVGSNLNSITRIAKGIQSKNNNKNLNEGINQLVKKSNTTIRNVVDVIWALDNEDSKLEDLIEKMEDYLDGIKVTNKDVEVRFVKKNIPKNTPLPMNAKHHLLMVFKEAVNNIQKHTNPSSVEVTMQYNQKNLDLNIANQFQSKKENSNSTGRGIINIRRRIMDLGGVVVIKETDNEFQLQIKVDNLW